MTNPNNAIGTNGAFGGRTSVNAFNDGLNAWTRGVMSGWACVPDSGMTVAIGGDPDTRDVAVAEDDAGNKTSINNISLAPVKMTIPGAPASNTRIDSIVAYVDNPPQGSADITDNYEACGIIVVSGTASSSPVPPNETAIRTAITSDGATGATAYYVVLANVSVATGTTDITAGEILAGDVAGLASQGIIGTANIADSAVTANKIDFTTIINNPDFIKVGTFTAVYQEDNSSGGFKEITFSSPFPSGVTPVVFVNNPLTTGSIGAITITSVTNSKFDILARHSGTGSTQSFNFYYVAINPAALAIEKV